MRIVGGIVKSRGSGFMFGTGGDYAVAVGSRGSIAGVVVGCDDVRRLHDSKGAKGMASRRFDDLERVWGIILKS